jgi:L-fuculose-phosphate aldolase
MYDKFYLIKAIKGEFSMHELQKRFEEEINEIVEASVRLGEIGYATSHGGNLCFRVDDNTILITPTDVSKRKIRFGDIVIIDLEGEVLFASGGRKPSGEKFMYLKILNSRPDIKGIIHAHPPILTGFACTESRLLERPYLPEVVVELGPVLSVDYKEPCTLDLVKATEKVIHKTNAFLMRNHGVTSCSPYGVLRALDMMEMLEAQGKSLLTGMTIGDLKEIPKSGVIKLEKTIKSRNLKLPGDPRYIKSLTQLFYP